MNVAAWGLLAVLLGLSGNVAAQEHEHGHHHHGAHVHGTAKLEVAVDGKMLSIHLESPLDNVVGFEHAPRTAKERASADRALALLKRGDTLFTPTPAAGCKLVEATVSAPVLEKRGDAGGHGDLDADYRFECADPARLTGIATQLFKEFGAMRRIDAVVVTASRQRAFTLSKRLAFMKW